LGSRHSLRGVFMGLNEVTHFSRTVALEVKDIDAGIRSCQAAVELTRTVQRLRGQACRVPRARSEVLADLGDREAFEVAQPQDFSVARTEQEQHSIDQNLAVEALRVRRDGIDDCGQRGVIHLVQARLSAQVRAARIAHCRDEPRARISDSHANREECEQRFMEQPFGVAFGNVELAACDVEEKRPVVAVKRLDAVGGACGR
jgi:hypothetical protein